jgi:hypothetical protein
MWVVSISPPCGDGDFNVNVKDNYNAELVVFMEETFELDILSDLSQGTTSSNSCINLAFGRNVDNLSCMKYISYFSYLRPILSRTNHQAPQLTGVTTNQTLWVISVNNVLLCIMFQ